MSQPGAGRTRSVGVAGYRRPDPQDLIEFLVGQRPLADGHGTEHFGIQFDLIQRNAVGDAKVEMLAHRAHLHRQADSRKPDHKATTRPYAPA